MRFTVEHPLGQHDCAPELYDPAGVAAVAAACERHGFDALAFTEHPAPPKVWVDSGGHASLDPLVALAFCAAATRRIKLLTHLLVAGYHRPLVLAKAVATADRLSAGRLILGLGNGYLQDEFDALGVKFAERSTRFDETVTILRNIWRTDAFSYEGTDISARAIVSEPPPVQLPHPPLWIGGTSRAARSRVARLGAEGWMPLLIGARLARATRTGALRTPEELAVATRELKEMLSVQGHDPKNIQVQVYSPESVLRDGYSPAAHVDYLGRLAAAGANWFVVRPSPRSTTTCCESLAQYRDQVITQL